MVKNEGFKSKKYKDMREGNYKGTYFSLPDIGNRKVRFISGSAEADFKSEFEGFDKESVWEGSATSIIIFR